MKKATLIIIAVMVLTLTACASGQPAPAPTEDPTMNQPATMPESPDDIMDVTPALDANIPAEDPTMNQPATMPESPDDIMDVTPELDANMPEVAEPTFPEVYDAVMNGFELPALMLMPDSIVMEQYGVDTEDFVRAMVLGPMMNVHADEIAVFEAISEEQVDDIVEGVEARQEALKAQWELYLPDQYENVENAKIVTEGNYVIFVVGDQAEDIVDVILETLK